MTAAPITPAAAATRSRRLGEFTAALRADDLPDDVVHGARRALVDWMAAVLAGAGEAAAGKVRGVVTAVADGGPCTVVGTPQRTSAPFAALANAYTAHLLDFDDVYNPSTTTIHLGSCVWPAVLAVAELRGLDGRTAAASYVAGFEVGARVARAAGTQHYESGWHVTGTAGHVAAAAAAAHALGLSPAATTHALGAATTQAAGVREVYGSDSKALHPGKAAMDGVLSALLAENGLTSTDTALDGPRGLLQAVTPSPDPAELDAGLGTTWHVRDNGHKLYPSASLTHPVIDAVLALDGLDPADVARVEVRMAPFAADVTALRTPRTGAQAKFSTAHCVAVALLHRSARPAEFTDAVALDPGVAALREVVDVVADQAVAKRGCRVRVELRDGRQLTGEVTQNRGTPGAPLADGEIEDKLVVAGDARLGGRGTDRLIRCCWAFDDVDDLRELMGATVPPQR